MIACRDCKFYDGSWGHSCHGGLKPDPIYGAVASDPIANRADPTLCGEKARWFKPTARRSFWDWLTGRDV
jgi:hypothetical protein